MTTHGPMSDLFVHKTTTLSQYWPPVGLTNGTPRVNKCLAAEMLKLGLILDPHIKYSGLGGSEIEMGLLKKNRERERRSVSSSRLAARVLLLKVLRSYFYPEFGRHASRCLGRYCHSLDYRE